MEFFRPFSLNIRGRVCRYERPQVMGIINATPDSFYAASRYRTRDEIRAVAVQMAEQGADMFDIGAYSTRSGASAVDADEELRRLDMAVVEVRKECPDIPVSIDTFRADVARRAILEMGADIINDVSGGDLDKEMFSTVAELNVPYVLMHMRGTPDTMQQLTDYEDVTAEVIAGLKAKIEKLSAAGVSDIIADPGFGFAKTLEQNYELLRNVGLMSVLNRPLLIGMSRKSMIFKALSKAPADSLEGTVAANTMALLQGASILRVHDVGAAADALKIVMNTYPNGNLQ